MSEKKKPLIVRFFKWFIPWKGDKFSDVLLKIIFMICIITVIGCLCYMGDYFLQRYRAQEEYNEISKIYEPEKNEKTQEDVSLSFEKLLAINSDVKGWISVNDTTLNYPVVQAADNDYYLYKNLYKKYDICGIPFLDYRNVVNDKEMSNNMIIYGHHMNFSGMFGVLMDYAKLDFYKQHPTVIFNTIYKNMDWKVCGAFYAATVKTSDGEEIFDYQNYTDLYDESRYNDFINQVQKRTVIDTGVDVKYGDKFITLSTCANEFKDGRFVVVARQVRDGEDGNVDVNAAKKAPNPLYPSAWSPKEK